MSKGTAFTVNLQFKSEITEIHQLVCSLELPKTGYNTDDGKRKSLLTFEFQLQTARLPYNIFQCNSTALTWLFQRTCLPNPIEKCLWVQNVLAFF